MKRVLPRAATSPRDAWLALRMLAWAGSLPILKRVLPLPRLVRLLARPREAARKPEREWRIAALSRRVFRTRSALHADNCLERSLVAYRYLGAAGAHPQLVVGASPGETVHGHVWVTVDGSAIHDAPHELAAWTPVVVFDADGTRHPARGTLAA